MLDYSERREIEDLEEEIEGLEEKLRKSYYSRKRKDLCRLLNLRKILVLRKGDSESLLLGEIEDFTKVCKLSNYEEVRMGFKLLFE